VVMSSVGCRDGAQRAAPLQSAAGCHRIISSLIVSAGRRPERSAGVVAAMWKTAQTEVCATPTFFVSVADKGVSACVRLLVLRGSTGAEERVGFNTPTRSGQGPCAGFAEKEGIPHPRCFL